MSTVLQHKRSSVQGNIPSTSDLALGEIAINTRDGKAFLKRDVSGTESVLEFLSFDTRTATDLVTNDTFVGDGTSTQFNGLSQVPASVNHMVVTINGVVQEPSTNYTFSGTQITFTNAPALSDAIEVRIFSFVVKTVNVVDYGFYEYDITTTTNTVSGQDRNYKTLEIDPSSTAIYLNGIKLKINSDFTLSSSTVSFTNNLVDGDFVEVHSYSKLSASNLTGNVYTSVDFSTNATVASNVLSSSVSGPNVIDAFLVSEYRSAKYLVQVTNGTDYHITEIMVIHNGTTVYMTEYATLYDNIQLSVFDADISGGYVRLLATPTNIGSSIRVYRTSMRI